MKSYVFFKDSFSRCEQIDLTVKKNIAFYAVGFLITTLQLHQVVFQSFVTPARCDNLGRCTPQFISIVRDGIYTMYLLYIITTSFLLQIFICNICLYSTFLFIFLMTYFWKRVPFLHVVNNESVTWKPFYVDWLRRQNLKTLRVRKCRDEMENRDAHIVISYFCLYFFLWNGIFFGIPSPHKRHDQYIFTHPQRQIDVLRDKMGMNAAPKACISFSFAFACAEAIEGCGFDTEFSELIQTFSLSGSTL